MKSVKGKYLTFVPADVSVGAGNPICGNWRNVSGKFEANQAPTMKNIFILLLFSFAIIGCASYTWSRYYPNVKINPDKFKYNLPVDYEDCLMQFDSILTVEVIDHYKMEDSIVAYIKLSQEMGGLFINFWYLADYRNQEVETIRDFGYWYKPPVLDKFINDGISDPEEMIRILFKCYHKKLNNLDYDWTREIALIKSFWESPKRGEGWVSKAMQKREINILNNYHFQSLNINDTIDVLYNRSPRLISKTPDWYYLSGILKEKYPEKYSINVKLISIESESKNVNYIEEDDEIINIGDTATYYANGWLKRGVYYFNYRRNKEYREAIGKNYR